MARFRLQKIPGRFLRISENPFILPAQLTRHIRECPINITFLYINHQLPYTTDSKMCVDHEATQFNTRFRAILYLKETVECNR